MEAENLCQVIAVDAEMTDFICVHLVQKLVPGNRESREVIFWSSVSSSVIILTCLQLS